MSGSISIAPDGARYPLPTSEQEKEAFRALAQRAEGRSVVVIQGLGFVGAAVAAATAACGRYFVIGVDLRTPEAYWKIASLNAAVTPFARADEEFSRLLKQAVLEEKNLAATSCEEAYELADVIVVDVQLDVTSALNGSPEEITIGREGYEHAIRAIGRHMREDALVIVETTVPIGMCSRVIRPILEQERAARGITAPLLLAHAYERVMPGKNYMTSIRRFWRTFAADDAASAARAREFLEAITDTQNYPLAELEGTTASEMAKLLENSYRAANIAFIHEWTLLAEKTGVNLWSVVDAIRVRKGTHDNMRYPGFGVGGYCLTKDSYLAQWGAKNLFGLDHRLGVTLEALQTNFAMPMHSLDLLREMMEGTLKGKKVLLCGISYLPDVPDTRHSPALTFAKAVEAEGAELSAHDPLVDIWPERLDIQLAKDLHEVLATADGVVFAMGHAAYRALRAEDFPRGCVVVDASNVFTDETATALHARGCRIAGAGKGHWRTKGYHITIS